MTLGQEQEFIFNPIKAAHCGHIEHGHAAWCLPSLADYLMEARE